MLVIVGIVVAYNSPNPAVFGHSADEIEGVTGGDLDIKVIYYPYNAMNSGGGSYKNFYCPTGYNMIACGCESNGYANHCSAAVTNGNYCRVSANLGGAVSITCIKADSATVTYSKG